jgi:hypothetical protein
MTFREQALRVIMDLSSTVVTLLVYCPEHTLFVCSLWYCYREWSCLGLGVFALESFGKHSTRYYVFMVDIVEPSMTPPTVITWR